MQSIPSGARNPYAYINISWPDAASFLLKSSQRGFVLANNAIFFSRLNFKHAVKRLEAYGYRVAKAKIAVEDAFSKTSKAVVRKTKIK